MEKDWVKVYTTTQPFKAELIKALLANYNIDCVIINKQDSAYVMIGELEVFVKSDRALRAISLIRKQDEC